MDKKELDELIKVENLCSDKLVGETGDLKRLYTESAKGFNKKDSSLNEKNLKKHTKKHEFSASNYRDCIGNDSIGKNESAKYGSEFDSLENKIGLDIKNEFDKSVFDYDLNTLKSFDDVEREYRVNTSFAKPIYDSLDSLLGESKQKYGLNVNNKDRMERLQKDISRTEFGISDYISNVRNVQNKSKTFEVAGDSNNLTYKLTIEDDKELRVNYSKNNGTSIEIKGSKGNVLKFSVNNENEAIPVGEVTTDRIDLSEILGAYMPFLVEKTGSGFDPSNQKYKETMDLMNTGYKGLGIEPEKKEMKYLKTNDGKIEIN